MARLLVEPIKTIVMHWSFPISIWTGRTTIATACTDRLHYFVVEYWYLTQNPGDFVYRANTILITYSLQYIYRVFQFQ